MSEDFGDGGSYSEYSSQSWFSRIGKAFGGIIVGLILIPVALFVLFWNEGRAVDTAESLAAADKNVVSISDEKVDPANEKKLVHTHGNLKVDETLKDDAFGIEVKDMVKLSRAVEMYSWHEDVKTETRKKLGGGTETKKTYSYKKAWSSPDKYQDSSNFAKKKYHNPPWPDNFRPAEFTAQKIMLGAFVLSANLVKQIDSAEPFPVKEEDAKNLPPSLKNSVSVKSGVFYKGQGTRGAKKTTTTDDWTDDNKKSTTTTNNEDADETVEDTDREASIGDLKVSYTVIKPHEVSVMAEQSKDTFRAFQPATAKATIEMLSDGNKSAKQMISEAEAANTMLTWIIRIVGFVVVAIGIFMLFNPLVVLADVLPILGNITGFLLAVFSVFLAFALSFVTIAIAWIVYRPMLAFALLAIAGVAFVGVLFVLFKGRGKKTVSVPAPRRR